MANLAKGFSEIAGAIGTFFSLTRANRQREHLSRSIDLYNQLKPHSDLSEAQQHIKNVIKIESERLVDIVTPEPDKNRDWGALAMTISFTALFLWLMWYLVRYINDWWIAPIEIFILIGTIGFIQSGIQSFSTKDKQA